MNNQLAEAVSQIKSFLLKGDLNADIADDVNLFEAGLLDSLQFMELIFLLEELTQKEIDVAEFDVMSVVTLRKIKEDMFGHFTDPN